MGQYFEHDPSPKQYRQISRRYGSHELLFTTCEGVFSKDEVDDYSLTLIEQTRRLIKPPCRVLDLGCGYGAVGIILAKICGDIELWQSDINQTAVELTQRNCEDNGVTSNVFLSDGYEAIPVDVKFDCVLLNPPIHAGKETVYRLFRETCDRLCGGGRFYIVMHKKHGASSAIRALEGSYTDVNILYKEKGLHVIACSR